jgi:hypothetical protein
LGVTEALPATRPWSGPSAPALAARPSGLPHGLLCLYCCRSTRGGCLYLILGAGQFGLSLRELAGQTVEPAAKLFDQRLGGRETRGQLSDFILDRWMNIAVPQVLDLLDDMWPIDLFRYGLSRSEPAKQGTLPLGP